MKTVADLRQQSGDIGRDVVRYFFRLKDNNQCIGTKVWHERIDLISHEHEVVLEDVVLCLSTQEAAVLDNVGWYWVGDVLVRTHLAEIHRQLQTIRRASIGGIGAVFLGSGKHGGPDNPIHFWNSLYFQHEADAISAKMYLDGLT